MDKTLPAVEAKPLNRSNPSYIESDALMFSDPEGLRSASLHHLVEKQAHKTPNAIAIIHEGKRPLLPNTQRKRQSASSLPSRARSQSRAASRH